ncbi:MAG: 4-alpha-glucanotransferase [Candidatus Tyrphobacter sp.]
MGHESFGDAAPTNRDAQPLPCFLPFDAERADESAWALSAQIYSLRSRTNWGVGDLGDLKRLAEMAATHDMGAVALSPLHQLHTTNPSAASPYGPSSRYFLNVLFIDVPATGDFHACAAARARACEPAFATALDRLRAAQLVDYAGAWECKREILEMLFAQGASRNDERFLDFVRAGGPRLHRFALYESLAEHFRGGWKQWPDAYAGPDAAAVREFERAHRERLDFHLYLQWLADDQLAAASRACHAMPVGLYRDLAVGVDENGADVWSEPHAFVRDVAIGAPPDPLNPAGQNWGLPPLNPYVMKRTQYASFAELVRANMRYAGALRIDHAMGLQRVFWIPRGRPASDGAYVRYPREDLLAILARESRQCRALIVGEDLGTVPQGFRERMAAAHALSCRLLYFERRDGAFKAPAEYPRLCAASIGTHDLPPLAGWWTAHDIGVRRSLRMIPNDDAYAQQLEERSRARIELVAAFGDAGLLSEPLRVELSRAAARGDAGVIDDLTSTSYAFLRRTPALIKVLQLTDVLGEVASVNVPGTTVEHPNWQRKLPRLVEDIVVHPF